MDNNAWDLVEGTPKEGSKASICSNQDENLSDPDAEATDAVLKDLDNEEDEEDDHATNSKRRSKSPAVESIRKISRLVRDKVSNVAKSLKKTNKELKKWESLSPSALELQEVPLAELCQRPVEFLPKSEEDELTNRFLPRILSPLLLKDRRKLTKENCEYLFRRADDSHYVDALLGTKPLERVHAYDPYCPVHGSRRVRARRKRLVNMHNLMASVDKAENEDFSPILHSQAYLAKVLRKRKRDILTGPERIKVERRKQKILMNLWIISIAFLFLFTGFHGLQNLQTSVNGRLGSDSLCALYISLAVSSLVIPSFVLGRLGCKITLITAISIHIAYMLANFIPKYHSLIPASILTGVAASCLWAAAIDYITQSGVRYANLNIEAQNVVIVRFFGYFFMIVHLGQVIGNIISSLILTNAIPSAAHEDQVDRTCGHTFDSNNISALSERAQQNLHRPSQIAFLSVVGVDLCCALVALLIMVMFLNSLHSDELASTRAPKFTARVLRLTLKNLRRPKPLLLIPLTLFNGVEQAFAVGIFTKAYVACGLGIAHIGYVMTAFGIADAVCSLVFGPLIKLFGRMPLFVFGAVINLLMIITLMIWPLNPGDRALFSAIAGVWGMADGVWNTQLTGFWVALLGRESLEVAFANYRFWMSSGLALGFALMRFTSIDAYLFIAFVFLLLGILGYFIVELYDMFVGYLKVVCLKAPSELSYSDSEMDEPYDGDLPKQLA